MANSIGIDLDGVVVDRAEIEERLSSLLVDEWIRSFLLTEGDCAIQFSNGLVLTAQTLVGSHQQAWKNLLQQEAASALEGIDPQDILLGMNVGRVFRSAIDSLEIHSSGSLTVVFEGGFSLTATTDSDIVDWQWCLALEATNPYVSPTLAFFTFELAAGELFHTWEKP